MTIWQVIVIAVFAVILIEVALGLIRRERKRAALLEAHFAKVTGQLNQSGKSIQESNTLLEQVRQDQPMSVLDEIIKKKESQIRILSRALERDKAELAELLELKKNNEDK